MKIINFKIIICALMLSVYNCSIAQSLLVRAKFLDQRGHKVIVDYDLKIGDKVISVGRKRKIKVELSLNKIYELTVHKEGFAPRIVKFSTYVKKKKDYDFNFELVLDELKTLPTVKDIKNIQPVYIYILINRKTNLTTVVQRIQKII